MTRDEAIESIKPDACPTCGEKAFRVTNGDGMVLLSIPSHHPIQLVCVECEWESAITHYVHSEPKPEIVYSK